MFQYYVLIVQCRIQLHGLEECNFILHSYRLMDFSFMIHKRENKFAINCTMIDC